MFIDSRQLFVCADIPADSEDLRDGGHHRAVPVAGQRGSLQVREQAHLPSGEDIGGGGPTVYHYAPASLNTECD